ncbi:hypothetical protein NKH77_14935 [Streptomyces sp. M19]
MPLVPVLQLYAADVPDLPYPPGCDLLQVLWCPYEHQPYYAPRPELRWRDAADVAGRPLLAEPPRPLGRRTTCCPRRACSTPSGWWSTRSGTSRRSWTRCSGSGSTGWRRRAAGRTGTSCRWPRGQGRGYPNWTQEPDWPDCEACGLRMEHLLTVDSAEFDGVSASTWLPVEDRPSGGRITDLPYERRRAAQSART